VAHFARKGNTLVELQGLRVVHLGGQEAQQRNGRETPRPWEYSRANRNVMDTQGTPFGWLTLAPNFAHFLAQAVEKRWYYLE
jgi:hypothetical protein